MAENKNKPREFDAVKGGESPPISSAVLGGIQGIKNRFGSSDNNTNQPKEFDAVLGGETAPPISGVILGGIEGVKNRLKSSDAKERAFALIDALEYPEEGFKLVVSGLDDTYDKVQLFAAHLLIDKYEWMGKQILLRRNPQLYFTILDDYVFENFNPNHGVNPLVSIAYKVYLYTGKIGRYSEFQVLDDFNLDALGTFINDSQVGKVEALFCELDDATILERYDYYDDECNNLINMIEKASDRLTNLRALFIEDRCAVKYHVPRAYLSDINSLIIPILDRFQNLEVLKLHGTYYCLLVNNSEYTCENGDVVKRYSHSWAEYQSREPRKERYSSLYE